ncbi:PREDICTED: uncharacterized protein LOC107099177 [Cyprinodon variegatus]|nr:PREDICTED: uncharacterized protein LOC107099177 [Cyprinodon variegatus]
MLLRSFCFIFTLLWTLHAAEVFVGKHQAASVLRRWRRANSGFLEELKQGNLERECVEEICDYEEAREVFEDDQQTREFWRNYAKRDPCLENPCHNNGTCLYVGNSYECQCLEGYEGRYCQTVFEDTLGCLYQNGHCEHFCDGSGVRRRCFCADGYQLADDGKQCISKVEFPCGQLPSSQDGLNQSTQVQTRLVGANQCSPGDCPWQVLLQLDGRSHCGGALIHPDWVITAAHCVHKTAPWNLTVVAGEHNLDVKDNKEQQIAVTMVIPHSNYNPATGDSDIALVRLNQSVALGRFVVPICLPTKDFAERELLPVRYHTVSGWGKRTTGGNVYASSGRPLSPILRQMNVPIIQNSQCSLKSQFNFTDNMLCAGYLDGGLESCRGDDGGPLVTEYGSTHFLTGVVAWGRGCPHPGYYGVYTKVAMFVDWVEKTMKNPPRLQEAGSGPSLEQIAVLSSAPTGTMFWTLGPTLGLVLLLHLTAAHVFLDGRKANEVLTRLRRANSFMEEFKQGNMERECNEERCSWEEAREIFEDKQKTDEFWAKYVDGDACESIPCAHGGHCKDTIGGYTCYCKEGYKGFNCEIVIPKLCENENGGCEHFCRITNRNVECSCADGYFLAADQKSCESHEKFKCGAIVPNKVRSLLGSVEETKEEMTNLKLNTSANSTSPQNSDSADLFSSGNISSQIPPSNTLWDSGVTSDMAANVRIVGGENCPPGECPWQALLINEDDVGFCGGTILTEYIILTAAHCMNQSRYFVVKLGEYNTIEASENEVTHHVEIIVSHNKYSPDTYHNDIALIKLAEPITFTRFILPACIPEADFAENVLMRQADGLVSGFGRLGEGQETSTILQRLSVPYVDRNVCMESTQLRITMRMFCAGYDTITKDACQGDSGGPHVTRYRDTYFITGIVSWGEGCARKGKYGVYTQVSTYIRWIRQGIRRLTAAQGSRKKRDGGSIRRLFL